MNKGTKAAAIDIGTHSVRMLSAVYDGTGFAGTKSLTITRLGEGLVQAERLGDEPMRRTVTAVRDFMEQARRDGVVGPVYCYATSAAREAQNGDEFLAMLSDINGLEAEIIDGDQEAMLSFQGASVLGDVVMDIGGGSTELSRMHNGVFVSCSVTLGTVTSLEIFLDEHDIGPILLMAMAQRGQPMVETLCHTVLGVDRAQTLVGVGGTATQLAMLFLKLRKYDPMQVHGFSMRIEELDRLQSQMIRMTSQQRQQMPGMHPKRADVIVAGCLIARMVMMQSGAKTLVASEYDGLDAYLKSKCRFDLDKE